MTAFILTVICLAAGALLYLLPPLWQRRRGDAASPRELTLALYRDKAAELERDVALGQLDAAQYDLARAELERGLAGDLATSAPAAARPALGADRRSAWLLGAIVPLGAAALYWAVGTPDSLRRTDAPAPLQSGAHPLSRSDIEAMIGKLAERLARQPEDTAGWAMLGRSYTNLGRYNDAAMAYEKSVALNAGDASVLIEYADILGVLQGKDLRGRPADLVRRALEIEPNHPKALALAGTAAFNEHQYVQAADYWERLMHLLQPGSASARGVAGSIAEAKALAAGKPVPKRPEALPVGLAGAVSLAPGLAARVAADDTLFIFARTPSGPPIPVAVLRRQARDLPMRFVLDDSLAMTQTRKLSMFTEVMVGARISRAGNALPESGDLEGLLGPVRIGSRGLDLVIDKVVP